MEPVSGIQYLICDDSQGSVTDQFAALPLGRPRYLVSLGPFEVSAEPEVGDGLSGNSALRQILGMAKTRDLDSA